MAQRPTLAFGVEEHALCERHDEKVPYGAQPSLLGKAGLLSGLEHWDMGISVPPLPCSVIVRKSYQPL